MSGFLRSSASILFTFIAIVLGICQAIPDGPPTLTAPGATQPLKLPAQKVGFITDSRGNNIRGFFDVLAAQGFTTVDPSGSAAIYRLPLAALPQIAGLEGFWDFSDSDHMWQGSSRTGLHPTEDGNPVGRVEDKSGNERDAIARGNTPEALMTNTVNGLPTVAGDGAVTLGFDVAGTPLVLAGDFTVVSVVDVHADNKGLLGGDGSLGVVGDRLELEDGAGNPSSPIESPNGDQFHLLVFAARWGSRTVL